MSTELFESALRCDLSQREMSLLKHSYLSFCAAENDGYDQNRIARALNGEVVSESETDNPEAYASVLDPLSAAARKLLSKK